VRGCVREERAGADPVSVCVCVCECAQAPTPMETFPTSDLVDLPEEKRDPNRRKFLAYENTQKQPFVVAIKNCHAAIKSVLACRYRAEKSCVSRIYLYYYC
jgi:hypothetical protein